MDESCRLVSPEQILYSREYRRGLTVLSFFFIAGGFFGTFLRQGIFCISVSDISAVDFRSVFVSFLFLALPCFLCVFLSTSVFGSLLLPLLFFSRGFFLCSSVILLRDFYDSLGFSAAFFIVSLLLSTVSLFLSGAEGFADCLSLRRFVFHRDPFSGHILFYPGQVFFVSIVLLAASLIFRFLAYSA